MNNFSKYVVLAMGLVLVFWASPTAMAQKKSSSNKQTLRQTNRKGPDGLVKGATPQGNAERQYLLDRQQMMDQQRKNGFSTGAGNAMPEVKYEDANRVFKVRAYENKNAQVKPNKKSRRVIDQDNPNGKMYQEALRKRERKFFNF